MTMAGRAPAAEIKAARERCYRFYGDNPQDWPSWRCVHCGQAEVGWSVECPRCGAVEGGQSKRPGLIARLKMRFQRPTSMVERAEEQF
jgi:hypothetical protein